MWNLSSQNVGEEEQTYLYFILWCFKIVEHFQKNQVQKRNWERLNFKKLN